MANFLIQLPAGVDPTNPNLPDRLAAYFTGKGYTVLDGAAIYGNGTALVSLDRDPSADVAGFTNQPTTAEQQTSNAITTLRAYIQNVRSIAPANRTPEQKAILAIAVLVHDLAQANQ